MTGLTFVTRMGASEIVICILAAMIIADPRRVAQACKRGAMNLCVPSRWRLLWN